MSKTYLVPYISFDGTCKEAMEFYQSCMGGKLDMMTFGQMPMPGMPEDLGPKIMHSMIEAGDLSFMASDTPPGMPFTVGNNVSICVAGPDEAMLSDLFAKLSAGGQVLVPLAKQPWGDVYGQFTDKFGIRWQFNIGEKRE